MGQEQRGGQVSCMGAARGPAARAVVRLMEIAGGGSAVGRRAIRHDDGLQDDANLWRRLCLRLGLSIEVERGCLDDLMRPGPLVVATSAPPSLIAPLVLGHILAARPGEFRILAPRALVASGLVAAAGLDPWLLAVAPQGEAGSAAVNRAALDRACAVLRRGGAVVCSDARNGDNSGARFGPYRGLERPVDGRARSLAGAVAGAGGKTGQAPGPAATVVHVRLDCDGVYLAGLAARIHPTLGLGLMLPVMRRGCDRSVRVSIGAPAPDVQDVMAFRHTASYA